MKNMIDPSGRQTPEFDDMVDDAVKVWIDENKRFNQPCEFIVMSAQTNDKRMTHWGVLDVVNTPEEDLYTEMRLRFYCALRTLGQENVRGIGIIDIRAILSRQAMPGA